MRVKEILSSILLIAVLSCLCISSTLAESYPIYQVNAMFAHLYKTPQHENSDLSNNVIYTVPYESAVLVAEETDGWYLVYTQDELFGYMPRECLQATDKKYEVNFKITDEKIAQCNTTVPEFLTVDPQAVLPEPSATERTYPATLVRGEQLYDLDHLLNTLLGEGYIRKERDQYSNSDDYQSQSEEKPYRYLTVYDDTKELWYYDSMVTGERGGEYTPPSINMTLDESLIFCRALLNGVLPSGWLEHVGIARSIQDRWSYADRWMTDSEYDKYIREADSHLVIFEHHTDDGISILEDQVKATVGVNGLSDLDINWHNFNIPSEHETTLMPLEDAIAMANRTRTTDAVLLYAAPVYSNWLTDNDEFNLSWYLVTSEGNYVVDCVLQLHECDTYEY